jgi:predicted dehydrogenase
VVGVRRGINFARQASNVGLKLVALCDIWEEKLHEAGKSFPDVALYTDFSRFLEHEMDAVILANFATQHAPLAIRALEAGLHVLSEVIAVKTLGEAVDLVRAVEHSGKIYMLAENYCYFVYNQEMRRLYQAGEIGEVQFAECEYNHPMAAREHNGYAPGINHWRNWAPPTYYPTHALGPILFITDTRPVSVNALSIPYSEKDLNQLALRRADGGSSILCRMDNGAVTHIFGLGLRGHSIWYRLHGTRGLMENLRTHQDENKLRIVHEPWDLVAGDVREKIYTPEFPFAPELAQHAGHSGGDFFTNFYFAEAIRTGEPPWLNIYRSLDMSVVAIQAWKSALQNGIPVEIPDFRTEAARQKYQGEVWSPFPEDTAKAPNQPPPSILGIKVPTDAEVAVARQVWDEMGFRE